MYYLANSGRALVILRAWNKKCPEWAPHVCGDGALAVASHSRYNPAYAGILYRVPLCAASLAIQPRVCGDTHQSCFSSRSSADTTPRMRGLPSMIIAENGTGRCNPAYARTTRSSWPLSADTTPRMRGYCGLPLWHGGTPGYNPAYAGILITR